MNELEEAGLRLKLAAAERERDELRAKIAEHDDAAELVQEYVDATAAAMDETCGKDEKHCTCVPLLRFESKRLRAEAATYAKSVHRLQKAFDDQCNASRQDASEIEKLKKERDTLAAKCAFFRDTLLCIRDFDDDSPWDDPGACAIDALQRANDCGRDYVPKEELREANEKLDWLTTSLEPGSLPYWQGKHDELAIKLAELLPAIAERDSLRAALKECVESLENIYEWQQSAEKEWLESVDISVPKYHCEQALAKAKQVLR